MEMLKQHDIDCLDKIFTIMRKVNASYGENMISIKFGGLTWGDITFMLNWKRRIGEIEFRTIEEAAEKMEDIQRWSIE